VAVPRPGSSKGLCPHGNVRATHKMARAIGANPLRLCFHGALPTARVPGVKNRTGVRDWQTQGDSTLRKKNGVSRRARRRSRGCARTLLVSFAEVDRRSWLREALSPIRSLSKEGRGTRWTGAWPTDVINRSKWRPLFQAAFTFRTKFSTAKLRVVERAVGDKKTDSRQAGCATPRKAGPGCPQGRFGTRGGALAGQIHGAQDAQSPLERAAEEQRISRRKKTLWTGKSFVVSRRRGGSGLGEPLRIGPTCTAKRHAPVSKRGSRQGRQKQVVACVGSVQQAPTVRRRSAEATSARRETRRSPVFGGRHPTEEHARRRVGDDEPERGGYGCSLTECREAETAQTYLDLVPRVCCKAARRCGT